MCIRDSADGLRGVLYKRICACIRRAEPFRDFCEHGFLNAELVRLANGTADKASQNVSLLRVARPDAGRDEERSRAHMVEDDAERARGAVIAIFLARTLLHY